MQIRSLWIALPFCFATHLFAQCVTFNGLQLAPVYSGGAITGLLHQPDGTYTAVVGTTNAPYTIQNVVPSFDQWIGSCNAPPKSLTLPAVSTASTPVGAASQVVAFGDFTGSGLPGAAFTATPSPQPKVTVGVITGGAAHLTTYTVPDGAATVATADFNKDGIVDLAVVYTGSFTTSGQTNGGVAILLGNGDGTFKSAVGYDAGANAIHAAIADLNGDGKLDIAVAADSANNVTILLGNGDGTFRSGATISAGLGQGPAAVIAADFNGDNKLDLATSNENGTVSILLGNGDGTFKAPQNFPAGSDCAYLAAADLNKDGKLDLVVTNFNAGVLAVLLGKGDGTFGAPAIYNSSYGPTGAILTDFNHDGNIDIVVGSGAADIITGDFGSGNIGVLLGNGDGTFQGTLYSAGARPQAIAAGDLNHDGKPDLIVANIGSNSLTVLLNQGNGTFGSGTTMGLSPPNGNPASPASVQIADVNGDGKMDAVFAVQGGGAVGIALGNGSGALQTPAYFTTGAGATYVAVGDLNGDGKPDLVVANEGTLMNSGTDSGSVSTLLGNGDGTFKAATNFTTGVAPGGIAIQDVNGDGKPDLVVLNLGLTQGFTTPADPGGLTVLFGNGDGTFQKGSNYSAGINPSAIAVGDLNGDGKPDIVVTTTQPNFQFDVAVLLNKGDGTFGSPAFMTGQFGMTDIKIVDLNADGKPDLVVASCCGDTQPSYFLGNGDGTFQAQVVFDGGPSPWAIAVADFNGDGKPDLAFADQGSSFGYANVLLNTSQPVTFTTKSATAGQIEPFAGESIVAAYGSNLATGTATATAPLGTDLDGTTVTVTDSTGVSQQALLFYVSSTQVNYEIPAGLATGTATVTITNKNGVSQKETIQIGSVSPGLFELDSDGLVAAWVLHVINGTQQPLEPVYQISGGKVAPLPIAVNNANDQVYLEMYGTGVRNAKNVTVKVGGVSVPVLYSGGAPGFAGEDQINIGPLPTSLAGKGNVQIVLTGDGVAANTVNVSIQ